MVMSDSKPSGSLNLSNGQGVLDMLASIVHHRYGVRLSYLSWFALIKVKCPLNDQGTVKATLAGALCHQVILDLILGVELDSTWAKVDNLVAQ